MSQYIECTKCHQVKLRIKAEEKKEGNRIRVHYRGECGRLWHRRTCPSCKYNQRSMENIQSNKIILERHICKRCGIETPNRYRCEKCWDKLNRSTGYNYAHYEFGIEV